MYAGSPRPWAQPPQLLVRLILNETAEHGEGSEGLVCRHHVAGSLQETGASTQCPLWVHYCLAHGSSVSHV